MPPKIISIEGNIGAGKTTLAMLIAEATGRQLILEQFEQNPFLADFYADQAQYAFHTELFFLAERYEQWRQMPDRPTVADYSFAKSLYFAEITLSGAELQVFNRLYKALAELAAKPDLTLYLYRSTTQLSQHIKERGRAYEQDIASSYLDKIHDNYLAHLHQATGKPILMVDAQHRDFYAGSPDLQWLLSLLGKDFSAGITRV